MSNERESKDTIRATISGQISGQVAVGKGISQIQAAAVSTSQVTDAELTALRRIIADLKARVEVEAPPDKKEAALERVNELEEAVTTKEPDLTTMEYVKNWFTKNIPGLAGAVTSIVVHPIVGKLVEVAGETLATEFRRRFDQEGERAGKAPS